jgi:hypothetical protein
LELVTQARSAWAYRESIDRGHLAKDEVIPGAGVGKISEIFHRRRGLSFTVEKDGWNIPTDN